MQYHENPEELEELKTENAQEMSEEAAQEAAHEQLEFEAAVEQEADNIREAEDTNLEDADPENVEEVELAAVHEVAAEEADDEVPTRDRIREELFEPYASIEKAIAKLPKYRQRRKAILALITPEHANESDFKELLNTIKIMQENNEDVSKARDIIRSRKSDMHVALYGEPIGRAIDSLYYKTDRKKAKMALMYPSIATPEDKKHLDNALSLLDAGNYQSYVADIRSDLSKRKAVAELQHSFETRNRPGRQPKTVPLANEFIRDLIAKSGMSEEDVRAIVYGKNVHNATGRQVNNVRIDKDTDKILTNIKDEETGELIEVPQTQKLRNIEDAEESEDYTPEQLEALIQALEENNDDIEEQAEEVSEEATELAEKALEVSEEVAELKEQVQEQQMSQTQEPPSDIQLLQQGKTVTTHIPAFIDNTDRNAYQRQLDKWNNLTVADQQKALNPEQHQGRGRGGRILDRMRTLSMRSDIAQKALSSTPTKGLEYTSDSRLNEVKEQIQHAQIDKQNIMNTQVEEVSEEVEELAEQALEVADEADDLADEVQLEELESELQEFANEFGEQDNIQRDIEQAQEQQSVISREQTNDSDDLVEWLNSQRAPIENVETREREYAVASAQDEPQPDANAMLNDPKYYELREELNSGDINRVIEATKQLKILANDYGFMDEEDALDSIDESPTDIFESSAATELVSEPKVQAQPTDFVSEQAKDQIREILNVTMSTFDKDEAHMQAGKILEGANTEGLRFLDDGGNEISAREWARRVRIGDPTKQRESTVPSFSDQLPENRQFAATTIADLAIRQSEGIPTYSKYLKFYAGNTMYVVDVTNKNITKYPSKTAGHPYETLDTMGSTHEPPKDLQIKFGEGSIALINGKVYWVDDGKAGPRSSIPRSTDSEEWKRHVTETFGSFARQPSGPAFPDREDFEDERPHVDIRNPEHDYGQDERIASNRAKRIGQLIGRYENVKEQIDFTKEADKVVKRENVHLEQLRRELSRAKAHIVDNPSVQVFDQIRRVENAIEQQKKRIEAAKDGRAEALGRTVVAPFVKSIDIPEIDRDYVRTHSGNPLYADMAQYPPTDPNYIRPNVKRLRKKDRNKNPRVL